MSFFDAFMPPESQGGGCFGEPKGLNVGDVLGQIGDLYGLGSVWTGLGSSVPVASDEGYRPKEWSLMESISAPDDPDMLHGLTCSVTMREVLVANVAVAKVSARQWTTDVGNKRNEVQPKPVKRTTLKEFEIQGKGWFGWWTNTHGGGGGYYGR